MWRVLGWILWALTFVVCAVLIVYGLVIVAAKAITP